MEKQQIDQYELACELQQIHHLLFFENETLDNIQKDALKYRKQVPNSEKVLAYGVSRTIDELMTLHGVIISKLDKLESALNGFK